MWRGYRRGFTAAEKTELWDRWQRGESLKVHLVITALFPL
jgi:hypothetical protein